MAPTSVVQEVGSLRKMGIQSEYGAESCKLALLGPGNFLFTCSDFFVVGCIVYSITQNAQRYRQTEGQTNNISCQQPTRSCNKNDKNITNNYIFLELCYRYLKIYQNFSAKCHSVSSLKNVSNERAVFKFQIGKEEVPSQSNAATHSPICLSHCHARLHAGT